MKKLVLLSAAALAIALTLNVSLSSGSKNGSLSLLQLSLNNQAEAECIPGWSEEWNNGGCGITGNCFWGREVLDCDVWRSN